MYSILSSIVFISCFLFVFFNVVNCQTPTGPGGFKIEIEGKVYSVNSDICTGGVFFKKPVKPTFICLHGYFLKRANGCSAADNEIIAASQYGCIDYPADKPNIQLLVPVTNSEFPGEHTVAFYEDADMLTNLRRYTFMSALQNKYVKTEDGARHVIVTNTHNTPEVNIGKICYDGISDEHGSAFSQDLGATDFSGGAKFGFFKKNCQEGSIKFDFSKAHSYPYTEALPRYIANEINAQPLKVPKRPLGMEGLEELLDKTPIMKPEDLEGGSGNTESTSRPRTTRPPALATPKPERTISPTRATSLKSAVKWVHPHPQVLDPLVESQILAAKLRIQSSMANAVTAEGTGFTMAIIGQSADSRAAYYTYTPLADLPATFWFKILGLATEVVKKAIPSDLVDSVFFDAIYNTFGNAFRAIPDGVTYFSDGEFEGIKEKLEKCIQNPHTTGRLDIQAALKDGKIKLDNCPLKYVLFSTKDEDGNDMEEKFETMPAHDYKYHPDQHEPVVETMWNVFESAFYICSEYLEEDVSDMDRLHFYMSEYFFVHKDVQERWFTNILNPETYQSSLPTGNIVTTMYNMDKVRALLRSSEDQTLDPEMLGFMQRPENQYMPTASSRRFEHTGNKNRVHHRSKTYSSFRKLRFRARASVLRGSHRYRRHASNNGLGFPDDDEPNNQQSGGAGQSPRQPRIDNNSGMEYQNPDEQGSSGQQGVPPNPNFSNSGAGGTAETGTRKDYEIWGGMAYCLQMVETLTDQELKVRGFTPSLQDMRSESLC